jgi:acetolactate synthase small subunit
MLTRLPSIWAKNHSDVLAHIVLLLHRMAIPVTALMIKRPKGWRRITLTIEVEADVERAERIRAHLLKIVQVISVKQRAHSNSFSQNKTHYRFRYQ